MKQFHKLADLLSWYGYSAYGFGRANYSYTDCGPWTQYLLDDGRTLYYESNEANDSDAWWPHCVAIQIGSIVEGSEVCVEARTLTFPFTPDDLDKVLREVSDEASYYWVRDNCVHVEVHCDSLPLFFEYGSDPVPSCIEGDAIAWLDEQAPNSRGSYETNNGLFLETVENNEPYDGVSHRVHVFKEL